MDGHFREKQDISCGLDNIDIMHGGFRKKAFMGFLYFSLEHLIRTCSRIFSRDIERKKGDINCE